MRVLFAFIFALVLAGFAVAQKEAEVTVTSTYLRAAPNVTAEKVETLQKGERIVLEKSGESNGWFYVSGREGSVKGWIRKDTISTPAAVKNNPSASPAEADPAPAVPAGNPAPLKNPAVKRTAPEKSPVPVKPTALPAASSPAVSRPNPPVNVPAAVSPAVPEEKPIEDNEILHIDTDEVSLNVRVVNGANRPVGNLTEAQFQVYEDDVPQPITALTTTEVPVINALLIDNSRSLRSQLAKVIEAGKIIVGTNRPKDESTIIRFVSSDKIEVVQDFTAGKAALDGALDNLFVEGGQTAIIDAVYRTAEKLERYQNSSKKEDVKIRSLIVVSDGDDRSSRYDERQLFKLLRDSNLQIYAIGFVDNLSRTPETNGVSRQDKAKGFLTRLAEETGGKVFFPASLDELPKIAADISGELRTQYTISYAPTNDARDGAFRRIRVEVAGGAGGEKRTAITRTGRNARRK